MELLLNNKEIAKFLIWSIDILPHLNGYTIDNRNEAIHVNSTVGKWEKWSNGDRVLTEEEKIKFGEKLVKAIWKDVHNWRDETKKDIELKRSFFFDTIHNNIEYLIKNIGLEKILKAYSKSNFCEFVKGTGRSIDPNGVLIRRHEFNSFEKDCLIRNTVGNEDLLVTKIDKGYPMWFIDSGYTNFLETHKKWHRLVRNHLHYGKTFQAPADRLGCFKKFPEPWRKGGEIIYIIEPGPFAASIFHCDLKTWKYDVAKELRKYTDKRIVFRKKAPKKTRPSLTKQLMNEDYHCVVSINSNAATEAIWAGIPAITLDTHITNPVTRNKLSDINNLYYGDLGNWLCMLSYSQFTKEELMDGTAYNLVRKYNV